MKILRVGDPHVRPSNIEESKFLMNFVCDKAIEHKVDRIEILGDLFHTHSVIRLESLLFWDLWLNHLSDVCEIVVLVGNHDMGGDFNSTLNSLSVFQRIKRTNLKIVDHSRLEGIFGYMPYYHSKEKFIESANSLADRGAKVLVCHQTIQGSKYENGMYAPDGAELDLISDKIIHIISGHIHSKQEFGRVIYPGTARWDTASDANLEKGIWVFNHDTTGKITSREFLSTESVCSPILGFQWKEGEEQPTIPEGSRSTIELIGTSDWISTVKSQIKGTCSIKTKITDSKRLENRQAGQSLDYFIKNLFLTSIDRDSLLKWMKELNIV